MIAYMARTEPRFVDHLRERFVEPMSMARREHDYRDADDYAEEFIRAVMHLGEARARRSEKPEATDKEPVLPKREGKERSAVDLAAPRARVQVRHKNGIWEVKADGKFRGDYVQKEQALAAAALLKLSLR